MSFPRRYTAWYDKEQGTHGNPHPVLVGRNFRIQTSRQTRDYLFCAEGERRLDRDGENWVMRHCYRGRGVFRLRTILQKEQPIQKGPDIAAYSATAVSGVEIQQLAYFAASVVWRASLKNWDVNGHRYEANNLGPYGEQLRTYLLGQAEFPQESSLNVVLSHLNFPVLAWNYPDCVRIDAGRCHRFHIPGITFLLVLGKQVPSAWQHICVIRGPVNPIYVGKFGDALVQTQLLALMGMIKTPQPYDNVIEGYEHFLGNTE